MTLANVACDSIVADGGGVSEQVEVVHVGLGPIGRQIAAYVADRPRYRSVGAVDVDPELVDQPLSGIVGTAGGNGVRVVGSVAEVKPASDGAIAIHCAGSSLERSAPTLVELLSAGYHVVSTCEELANPWATQPKLAAELDRVAKQHGVVLLGTGVNPGFAMDYVPVVLAASQRSVRRVSVHRVQDAGQRRLPLQRKVGAGLTVEEFAEKVASGQIRHVGQPESARIIDRALDLGCDEFIETIDPVVAGEAVSLGDGKVAAGRVLGIDQLVLGKRGGETVIRLHLQMAVGLADPRDEVTLDGEPGLHSVVRGLHGDVATAAVVVNTLGRVHGAQHGLRTVDEVPAAPLYM